MRLKVEEKESSQAEIEDEPPVEIKISLPAESDHN
jgi:hypothetical protein